MSVIPWPTLPAPQLLQGIKLFTEERQILPYFDGYRDFADVMQASGHHDVAVLQAAAILNDAGRLLLFEPEATLTVTPLKSGLFKKGDHVEAPKSLEARWIAMEPYAKGVRYLRMGSPKGPWVERVEFVSGLGDQQVAVPREFMQAWDLAEGSHVTARPAPSALAKPPHLTFNSLP
jgi:hypothetical protein